MSTMTVSTTKTKRPSSITLISVFEILIGFYSFYFIIFSPGLQKFIQDFGVGETLFIAFSGIVDLVSGVGFWFMKKWAVYMFSAFAVITQINLLVVGRWNVFSLLLLAVPIFIGYRHFSKMT